jgi:hypothetical protein
VAPPGGRELFGAPLGVAPQLQPLQGMLLRRSTDIYPKELARDMREFFNSLLGAFLGDKQRQQFLRVRATQEQKLAVLHQDAKNPVKI